MNNIEKLQVVEAILERACEQLGDITEPVMSEFYRADSALEAVFTQHRPVDTIRLEAGMVEQALYCYMRWFESPGEIEMTLLGSVPHHVETLNVSVEHYRRLLLATETVVRNTIPEKNEVELAVWREISASLLSLIETATGYVYSSTASAE